MDSNKMGAFIAQVRKERGLTQLELAQKINVTDKAVSKWERGVGFPDIKIIEALAEALGVSVSELMNGERMENAVRDSESDNISNDDILTENKKYAGKIVNFRTYIIVLAAVVLSLSIFLLDSGGFDGAFFVYIPFIMELVGVLLIVSGIIRYKKKVQYKGVLIAGIITLLIPVSFTVFLIVGVMLGLGRCRDNQFVCLTIYVDFNNFKEVPTR